MTSSLMMSSWNTTNSTGNNTRSIHIVNAVDAVYVVMVDDIVIAVAVVHVAIVIAVVSDVVTQVKERTQPK